MAGNKSKAKLGKKKTNSPTKPQITPENLKILQDLERSFLEEEEDSKFHLHYKKYRRRSVIKRGKFTGTEEDLNYGKVSQKWITNNKIVNIKFSEITLACK
jgi:hypothetical protein